ncbi:MAG: hypothetical protein N2C14_20925 [Planctomycetales bacterium]
MGGVGTRKTFENDQVAVWDLELQPGEEAGRHTHRRDYVVRVLSGAVLEIFDGDGKSLGEVELEPGAAVCFRIEGDLIMADRPGYPEVPATHNVRNVGETTFREVLVEFKDAP